MVSLLLTLAVLGISQVEGNQDPCLVTPFGSKMCRKFCRLASGYTRYIFSPSELTCRLTTQESPVIVALGEMLFSCLESERIPSSMCNRRSRNEKGNLPCVTGFSRLFHNRGRQLATTDKRLSKVATHVNKDHNHALGACSPVMNHDDTTSLNGDRILIIPVVSYSKGASFQVILSSLKVKKYEHIHRGKHRVKALAFDSTNRKLFVSQISFGIRAYELDGKKHSQISHYVPTIIALDADDDVLFIVTKERLDANLLRMTTGGDVEVAVLHRQRAVRGLVLDTHRKRLFISMKKGLYSLSYTGSDCKILSTNSFLAGLTIDTSGIIYVSGREKIYKIRPGNTLEQVASLEAVPSAILYYRGYIYMKTWNRNVFSMFNVTSGQRACRFQAGKGGIKYKMCLIANHPVETC